MTFSSDSPAADAAAILIAAQKARVCIGGEKPDPPQLRRIRKRSI